MPKKKKIASAIHCSKPLALSLAYFVLAELSLQLANYGAKSLCIGGAELTLAALMGLAVLCRCTSQAPSWTETEPFLRNDIRRTVSLGDFIPPGATPLRPKILLEHDPRNYIKKVCAPSGMARVEMSTSISKQEATPSPRSNCP